MNKLYIGVDASMTGTGVAVISNFDGKQGFSAVSHFGDKCRPLDKVTRGRRHRMIAGEIKFWWEDTAVIEFEDITFVFEHFSLGSKGRVADLAELIGYLKALLPTYVNPKAVIKILEVPPTTLKKFTADYGFADKEMMKESCKKQYGRSFVDDNECDAYCLAQLGKYYEIGNPLEKKHRDLKRAVTAF